jgi:hypothetical protein
MTRYPNNEQRGDQHIDRQPDADTKHNAAHFSAQSVGDNHWVQATHTTDNGKQQANSCVLTGVSREVAERIARGMNTCMSMLLNTDWTGPQ